MDGWVTKLDLNFFLTVGWGCKLRCRFAAGARHPPYANKQGWKSFRGDFFFFAWFAEEEESICLGSEVSKPW